MNQNMKKGITALLLFINQFERWSLVTFVVLLVMALLVLMLGYKGTSWPSGHKFTAYARENWTWLLPTVGLLVTLVALWFQHRSYQHQLDTSAPKLRLEVSRIYINEEEDYLSVDLRCINVGQVSVKPIQPSAAYAGEGAQFIGYGFRSDAPELLKKHGDEKTYMLDFFSFDLKRLPITSLFFTDVVGNEHHLSKSALAKLNEKIPGQIAQNALERAAQRGDLDTLRALLEKAKATKSDLDVQDALGKAAAGGQAEALRVLIAHGADVNSIMWSRMEPPLISAARGGHVRAVEALLAAGADVNQDTLEIGAKITQDVGLTALRPL